MEIEVVKITKEEICGVCKTRIPEGNKCIKVNEEFACKKCIENIKLLLEGEKNGRK